MKKRLGLKSVSQSHWRVSPKRGLSCAVALLQYTVERVPHNEPTR